MARQEFTIGAAGFTDGVSTLVWQINVNSDSLINSQLVAGEDAAYLRYFYLTGTTNSFTPLRLRTSLSSEVSSLIGPNLTSEWEASDTAITIRAGDTFEHTFRGPTNPQSDNNDSTEPYTWSEKGSNSTKYTAIRNQYLALSQTDKDATVLILDDGVVVNRDITSTITAGQPSLSAEAVADTLFSLSAWTQPDNTDLIFSALLEASDPGTAGNNIYADSTRGGSDSPIEGELGLGASNTVISRIRNSGNGNLLINDNNNPEELLLSAYFGSGGEGSNGTFYLRTSDGTETSFPVTGNAGNLGGGFANFSMPVAFRDHLESLGTGDRFVFAFVTPVAPTDRDITSTIRAGNPVISASAEAVDINRDITSTITAGQPSVSASAEAVNINRDVAAVITAGNPTVTATAEIVPAVIPDAPVVTDTQITSTPVAESDTYGLDEIIEFQVTYDVDVDVTGSPRFPMNFGQSPSGNPEYADYDADRSTARVLAFVWAVAATDEDTNGVFLYGVDSTDRGDIDLNGGTIRRAGTSVDAELTTTNRGTQSGHKVDGSLGAVINDVSATITAGQPSVSASAEAVDINRDVAAVITAGNPTVTATVEASAEMRSSQVFDLGTVPTDSGIEFHDMAIQIDPQFIKNGEVAYLRYLNIDASLGVITARIAGNETDSGLSQGPEFSDLLEAYNEAFTIENLDYSGSNAESRINTFAGPDHPDNDFRDPSEPYTWNTPGDSLAFFAFDANIGDRIRLTLRDGSIAITNRDVTATITAGQPSVSASVQRQVVVNRDASATITAGQPSVSASVQRQVVVNRDITSTIRAGNPSIEASAEGLDINRDVSASIQAGNPFIRVFPEGLDINRNVSAVIRAGLPSIFVSLEIERTITEDPFLYALSSGQATTAKSLGGEAVKIFLELQSDPSDLSDILPKDKVAHSLVRQIPTIFSDDSFLVGSSDIEIRLSNTRGGERVFDDSDDFVGMQAQLWGFSHANARRLIFSGEVSAQRFSLQELVLVLSDAPIEALELSLPKRTITEEEFPTSQNQGAQVPVVIGRAVRHPCPNISIGYESTLSSDVSIGATSITLESTIGIAVGDAIAVGLGTNNQEKVKVSSVDGNTVNLASALVNSHLNQDVVINFNHVFDYLLGEGAYSEDGDMHFQEVANVYHENMSLPDYKSSNSQGSISGSGEKTLTLEHQLSRPLANWYESFVVEFYTTMNGETELRESVLIDSYDIDSNQITFTRTSSADLNYNSYRLREFQFFDGSQEYPYPGYAFIRFAVSYTGEIKADVKGFNRTNPCDFLETVIRDTTWGAGEDSFVCSSENAMPLSDYEMEGAISRDATIAQLVEEAAKFHPLKISKRRGRIHLELQKADNSKSIGISLSKFNAVPQIDFLPTKDRGKKLTVKYRPNGGEDEESLVIDTEGDSDFDLGTFGTEKEIELPFAYSKRTADRVLYRRGKLEEGRRQILECDIPIGTLIDKPDTALERGRGLQVGEKISFSSDLLMLLGVTEENWEVRGIEENSDVSYQLRLAPYVENIYSPSSRLLTEEEDPFDPETDYSQAYPPPIEDLDLSTTQTVSSTGEEKVFVDSMWTKPEENYGGAHVYFRETLAISESFQYAGIASDRLQFEVSKANVGYTVRVVSISEDGVLEGSPVEGTINSARDTESPPIPNRPVISGELRNIDINIPSYDAPADFARFEYDLDPNYPGQSDSFFSADTHLTLTFPGEDLTSYRVRARGIDRAGNESSWSPWSNTHTLTIAGLDEDEIHNILIDTLGGDNSDVFLQVDNNGNPVGLEIRSVDGVVIESASIPGSAIQTRAIDASRIALDAITADLIAAGEITSNHIQDGAISSPKILAGAIIASHLGAGSVTAEAIITEAITAAKIAAGAISTSKLRAGAVTANIIASNAIVASKIAASSITASKISAQSVTASKMAAGSIILDSAVVTGTLSADHISGDVFNAVILWSGSLAVGTSNNIEDRTITLVNSSNYDEYIIGHGSSGRTISSSLNSSSLVTFIASYMTGGEQISVTVPVISSRSGTSLRLRVTYSGSGVGQITITRITGVNYP